MLDEIIKVARNAGKRVLKYSEMLKEVEEKGGKSNYVTQYDKENQELIEKELKELFPFAVFVGEENGEDEIKEAEYLFIIDPIDGTTNFIRNLKCSAVSIGVLKNKEQYIGVVYNPYLDEMFYAQKGCGAFLNGKPIHATDKGITDGVIAFGTSPYNRQFTDITFERIKKVFERSADVRRLGSATIEMCDVACGRCDLFYEHKLSVWDFAASSLIVKEAGGVCLTSDFEEIKFDGNHGIVCGSNNSIKEFKEIIS